MSPSQVTHIIISSVVPPLDSTLRQVCETYFHLEPLFVEPGIKTGMPVLVDNPTELGADRLADCIAAYRALRWTLHRGGFRHGHQIRGDFGEGRVPGRSDRAGTWHQRRGIVFTGCAPEPRDIKRPAKVIGTNTVRHFRVGCITATSGWWTAFWSASLPSWGSKPRVIATGGLARHGVGRFALYLRRSTNADARWPAHSV